MFPSLAIINVELPTDVWLKDDLGVNQNIQKNEKKVMVITVGLISHSDDMLQSEHRHSDWVG
jgi:hypothetical protein